MARAGRVNPTAALASWWSEVAGSVVLRGPHGTFADVSTLDHREGFESGNSLRNPRGLEHLNHSATCL